MKRTKTIIFSFFAFFLLACSARHDYNWQLVLADSLMQLQPDSTLFILQNISNQELATRADSAYYALLMTQAKDQNCVLQTDDSLIRIAAYYYDAIGDIILQAKAHYYYGCVWRDKNNYPKAIVEYRKARTFAEEAKDVNLLSCIYSNVGHLYYSQELDEEADSIYKLAEQLAVQQQDTTGLVYALLQRGMINLKKGEPQYVEAERLLQKALFVAEHFSDSSIKLPVYGSLGDLYNKISDRERTLFYARLSYLSEEDTINCYRAFLLLGDTYFMNAQYDSAEIYLQKIFSAEKYYDTKADACMRLSKIARIRGDMEGAVKMWAGQLAYLDSAEQNHQGYEIFRSAISQERKNCELNKEFYENIIIVLVLAFLILTIIVMICYTKRSNKQKLEEQRWKEKLQLEISLLACKKQALIKGSYENSVVYSKLKKIARDLIRVETKENLTLEEWEQLVKLTDAKWNGIITYLNAVYILSAEEIQICCLYLADVPVKHIGHFIRGYARSTVQLKAREILAKMGASSGSLLKDVLFSLSEELKGY